jgi:hypothetical protein
MKKLLRTALLIGLAFAPAARAAGPARPSFLFIYTDDQRYDALGVAQREEGERARFPWFKTPNMDRLAVNGAPPEREPLKGGISKAPNDGLQIGDDLGSLVLGTSKPPAFRGLAGEFGEV